jgi:hypothetical protein
LLGWINPSFATVGTMKTSTSRDITQCAMDCSRYCRVFDWIPLPSGRGWNRRGDTPIFSASGETFLDNARRSECAACRRGITPSV